MLASQELKQQADEAIKIAEEAKKPRAASKASSPAKTETVGREPDLTGGIDIEGLRFPANVMMANSASSLSLGNQYSNSMNISGVVKRVVLMPGGYAFVAVSTPAGVRWAVVFATGMTAELQP